MSLTCDMQWYKSSHSLSWNNHFTISNTSLVCAKRICASIAVVSPPKMRPEPHWAVAIFLTVSNPFHGETYSRTHMVGERRIVSWISWVNCDSSKFIDIGNIQTPRNLPLYCLNNAIAGHSYALPDKASWILCSFTFSLLVKSGIPELVDSVSLSRMSSTTDSMLKRRFVLKRLPNNSLAKDWVRGKYSSNASPSSYVDAENESS